MECRVESLGGGFVEAIEQMPVSVQCHRDRGMPEAILDDLGVLALSDEHCRMRVAEIMNSKQFTNRGTHRWQPGSSPKVAAKKWSTLTCAEHEPLSGRQPCGQVTIQLFSQELGQCQLAPSCRRLGRSQPNLSTYLGECFGDREGPSHQVKPVRPTVRHMHRAIRCVLDFAVEDRAVPRNVANRHKLPKDKGAEHHVIGIDELVELVDRAPDRFRSMLLLVARRHDFSEVAGLRVSDIDFLRKSVKLTRQLARDGKLVDLKTKASRRRIRVSERVVVKLSRHLEQYGTSDERLCLH